MTATMKISADELARLLDALPDTLSSIKDDGPVRLADAGLA